MHKKFISLMFVGILVLSTFLSASAQGTGEIFPNTPLPAAEENFSNEITGLWFVELSSPPTADGTSPNTVKAEKAAFRSAAKNANLKYTERYAFDTLWNGLSIRMATSELPKLKSIAGVKNVFPVTIIALPETTPVIEPELFTAITMTGADIVQTDLGFTGQGVKVAVMDTGLDYDHPDLGGCFGPGCRVETGWDFVGDAYNADPTSAAYNPVPTPDPDPDDCNGHGTHVSGIIGANGTVKGVAPDVTFGAYRVFGCAGSTTADIMVAAMEQALKDKMQVLNMSIGSAFQWPQYPTAVASSNLVDKGVVVVASIGNSGTSGLYAAGAPGLGEKVIGVASFDNSHVYVPYFEVNGTKIGYITMTFSPPPPTSGSGEIVDIGLACSALPAGSLTGKVALAARGTCSFAIKATNAIAAGADAVLVSNNIPGILSGTLGGPLSNPKPVVGISLADGNFIRSQAAPIMMTWTDQMTSAPSPTGGLISSFSSYGLSPDLALKPDLGAPGGNIYSTYPLESGGYANMSGTSMASPHVAGAAALYLQANPAIKAEDVRGIFQNNAVPKLWWGNPGLGFLDNVHRQGAGMLRIDNAILATTAITPAKLSLGEGETGSQTFALQIANNSVDPITYDLNFVNALSTGGVIAPSFSTSDASVVFDMASITVQAGRSAAVLATITPATGPVYGQYGGYITVTPQGGSQVYRVPFAGFVGDYQAIQALTPTPAGLPWLTRLTSCTKFDGLDCVVGGIYANQPAGATYTLTGMDFPYIVLHLEHQVSQLIFEIYDQSTGKLVHPVFNRALDLDYVGRNSTSTSFFAYAWDGSRIHSNGYNGNGYVKNLTKPVPDGQYVLVVKALKALGDANNPAHWETWTSPVITIDRP